MNALAPDRSRFRPDNVIDSIENSIGKGFGTDEEKTKFTQPALSMCTSS